MKKEARTGACLGHVAKLIDDIPIALPTTGGAGGASATQTTAVLEVEATLPNGEQNPGNLIHADAKADRSVAGSVATVGKHRRAEPEAAVAPR